MRHADAATLGALEALLEKLRSVPALREKKPGVFYVRSKPYLHFHQDPTGIFADVKLGGVEFERFPVNTESEQRELLGQVVKNQKA